MNYGRAAIRMAMAAIVLCIAGGALAAAGRTEQRSPLGDARKTAMQRYLEQADAAIEVANQSDGKTAPAAAASLSALIDDPLFTMISKAGQRMLVSAKALATWRQGDPEGARDLFLQATRIDGNDPNDWYRLAVLESDLGDRARSARYMTGLVSRWPELANNLDRQFLNQFIYQDNVGIAPRTALLQALFDAGWNDRHNGVGGAWRELALGHLANGNLPAAATVVSRIDNPLIIIQVRSDKRFDVLAETVNALPSARDAAEHQVAALRQHAMDAPKRVDLASTLGSALLVAGRHEEALASADAMLAAIAADDPSSFEHLDEKVWVMNYRAIALRRLGRMDEAVAQIEQASHVEESGTPNVSQVLNLASFYCDLGRGDDARRTIERAGSMSGYGRMVQNSVRHCAALQAGDRRTARQALDYLVAHRSDSELIVLEALLREGRLDEAARALIGLLEGPETRGEALYFVQGFRRGPELVGIRALNANRRAMLAREDVQDAVAGVGRSGVHDVFDVAGIE